MEFTLFFITLLIICGLSLGMGETRVPALAVSDEEYSRQLEARIERALLGCRRVYESRERYL